MDFNFLILNRLENKFDETKHRNLIFLKELEGNRFHNFFTNESFKSTTLKQHLKSYFHVVQSINSHSIQLANSHLGHLGSWVSCIIYVPKNHTHTHRMHEQFYTKVKSYNHFLNSIVRR